MGILRVKEAFSVLSDPSGHVYTPGELVDSDHPHVKVAGLGKFETVEAHVSARAGVEQATAEPGEKRIRSRAKKGEAVAAAEPAREDGES